MDLLERISQKTKIPENVLTTIIMLAFGAVILCVFYLPQKIEERECERFAAPLFQHATPEGSYVVQTSSVRDDAGGTTAAIILGTSLTEEELLTAYSDVVYVPARDGETVELSVKPLDEGSISALKNAGRYREEDDYYFIYIYSSKTEA